MKTTKDFTIDRALADECRRAWDNLAMIRRRRSRCVDFAFGRQWDDPVRLPSGTVVTEGESFLRDGTYPLTNNLLRRLIKNIIGRWRMMMQGRSSGEGDLRAGDVIASPGGYAVDTDTDARALEEFLISGIIAQRVEEGSFSNVSPDRIFFRPFSSPDASDCTMLGMLHDLSAGEILRRFSGGDPDRALLLCRMMSSGEWTGSDTLPLHPGKLEFDTSRHADRMRVIEVWRRAANPLMLLHDPEKAELSGMALGHGSRDLLRRMNSRRKQESRREIIARFLVEEPWEQVWLTPGGDILARRCSEGLSPCILLGLYPMINGEVHSLVEEMIGQQKYVNRLVTLNDRILGAAAKGVVLFPTDQLPDGMTWDEMRRLWASPTGIIPFRPSMDNMMPRQIHSTGGCAAASEMLRMQLEMFDDVAGSSGMLSTRRLSGADMMRQEMENQSMAVIDMLAVFRGFTERRRRLMAGQKEGGGA